MICVYDVGNTNFEGNGDAVLHPTGGTMKQEAGGNYDLTMTHPMDPEGKWKHLQPEAIIRIPVPEEEIENAFAGYAADVYRTTEDAPLREEPVEPRAISYPEWDWQTGQYEVGSKVSTNWRNHKNYQCTYYDPGSPQKMVPPYNSSWWTPIADSTSGAAVLATLPAGTELYYVEDVDATWYKMSTYYGIQGYIRKDQVEFWRRLTPEETKPRIIRNQLFRIVKPVKDTKNNVITLTARHVSYDLRGNLIREVNLVQAAPAMAIGRMTEALMTEYSGTIATNLTSEENGTWTGTIKRKNGIFALMDPDSGIIRTFDAALKRDNWDIFILKKADTDRGFRIKYRKNMLGVSWSEDADRLITRVVPVAKDEKGADLYLPEVWIDSEDIQDHPVIMMDQVIVKGQVGKAKGENADDVWTAEDLYAEMRQKARELFSIDQADQTAEEITVDFEMLGSTEEYQALKGLEKVLLYDTVQLENERIGLNKKYYVSELEWDYIRKKIVAVKLTNSMIYRKRSVTGYNVNNKSIGPEKLTDDVVDEILEQTRDIIPEYTDPDAVRPVDVVDNLESTSTDTPLSANMGRVLNETKLNASEKATKNGVATLDENGKVPSNQLPDFVDDVQAYASKSAFPASGKIGIIYIANDSSKTYRWTGSAYVELSSYTLASQADAGLMSAADKIKLDGIEAQANKYVLPLAASGTRGGVKIGYEQNGKNYPVQLSSEKMFVNVPWTDHYAWSDITDKPETATRWPTWNEVTGKPSSFYTLPLAASGTRGGIQIGYTQSGKNYPVQLSGEKAYVNVPWTDTHDWASITGKPNRAGSNSDGGAANSAVKLDSRGRVDAETEDTKPSVTGLSMSEAYSNGYPTNYGNVLTMRGSGAGELFIGWSGVSGARASAYIRSQRDKVGANWSSWYEILDSGNYTSFTMEAAGASTAGKAGMVPAPAAGKQGAFLRGDGTWQIPAGTYSLPLAASGTRGGIQIGYTQSGKNYPVQLSGEKAYVNVPWENTWRGIQNVLTSSSTTDSLSAAQGKNLQDNKLDKIAAVGLGSLSGGGQNNYFQLAVLTITRAYINIPVVFEISRRRYGFQRLIVIFASLNGTDPDIYTFGTDGQEARFWIKKTATSQWTIYGQYDSTYGNVALHRITGYGTNNGVNVEVALENAGTTEPTDAIAVTHYWKSAEADAVVWNNVTDKPSQLTTLITPLASGSITGAYTGHQDVYGAMVYKMGDMCWLNLTAIADDSTKYPINTTLFTIPADYRPSEEITLPAMIQYNHDAWNAFSVKLRANGTIIQQYSANCTGIMIATCYHK